jgi:hypothetical protein
MLTAGARETHQQLIGGTVDNENNGQITWETWEVPLLHGKWDGKSDLDEVFRNPAIERVSLSIVACHPLSRFTPTLDACSRVFWAKVPPKPRRTSEGVAAGQTRRSSRAAVPNEGCHPGSAGHLLHLGKSFFRSNLLCTSNLLLNLGSICTLNRRTYQGGRREFAHRVCRRVLQVSRISRDWSCY